MCKQHFTVEVERVLTTLYIVHWSPAYIKGRPPSNQGQDAPMPESEGDTLGVWLISIMDGLLNGSDGEKGPGAPGPEAIYEMTVNNSCWKVNRTTTKG